MPWYSVMRCRHSEESSGPIVGAPCGRKRPPQVARPRTSGSGAPAAVFVAQPSPSSLRATCHLSLSSPFLCVCDRRWKSHRLYCLATLRRYCPDCLYVISMAFLRSTVSTSTFLRGSQVVPSFREHGSADFSGTISRWMVSKCADREVAPARSVSDDRVCVGLQRQHSLTHRSDVVLRRAALSICAVMAKVVRVQTGRHAV